MTTRFMLEHPADESFARAACGIVPHVGARPGKTSVNSIDHEGLAAMSLSSLLYYVLVEEREVADEFA
jgi:hypothetical protein